MPRELSVSAFKAAVIDASRPVLVRFYTDGCGPCQMQTPLLEKIESRLRTATIFEVNAERNPELVALLAVRSVPTLILFAGGKIARRFTGMTEGRDLITAILASWDECQTGKAPPMS